MAGSYDTIIQNGIVIDTLSKVELRADIAIKDGKIAAVEPSIPSDQASQVIDATNQYVCPGLIDLHTHVYWGATYWGIEADALAANTGVTTWVDAGSAGAYTFPGFRRYIVEQSQCRVFSLLHVSALGLTGRTFELTIDEFVDVEMAVKTIQSNIDIIKGIKVRLDRDATNGTGLRGMERARQVSDQTGVPIMIHVGLTPPDLSEFVQYMKKGDILTHCCTGLSNKIVSDDGNMLPVYHQLKEKGVILDLGHGSGSFDFSSAETMIKNNILPDVLSSDLHQISRTVNVYDLPTTLSKYLNMGIPLTEVIARATIAPASVIKEPQLGHLKVGNPADIACFRIDEGEYVLKDAANVERIGKKMLVNTATFVDGVKLKAAKESETHPWVVRDLTVVAALGEKNEDVHMC
ncbi:amidohydrolase [Umbelopsis sp. PMI_123]|nr:amidohydrolase [Umbelopsis sp. PMI_123]